MDIHRCRFVDYPPSTINALAFSHSVVRRKAHAHLVRLAIGRANGDIEIWNPLRGAWLQETVLRGGQDRSVDGLVWTQDPDEEVLVDGEDGSKTQTKTVVGRLRLFSIGYTTTVTEWDLERGVPRRQSGGNHGEIWCLAAQPALLETGSGSGGKGWAGQKLVAGCTDGAVVLYSTEDGDLKLERVLVKPSAKRAKVISIAFQDRNIVVAGCTDSTIRIYDIRNAALVRSISLGAGVAGGPKETIVWAVKCLRNGQIVSGDSTGEIRIWDGKTYTLTQRIKSHKQDVLSLATNNAGDTILSGGMDRRTVIYKQTEGPRSRWAKVSHQRFHSHDVKTMATCEGNGLSIVASGGPDASPMIVPLRKFGLENQRMLPRLPQEPPVQSAPAKRLVMSWWDREVNIWSINESSKTQVDNLDSEDEEQSKTRSRKLVAKVFVKGEANITSASISTDGKLLAVATLAEVKVFALKSYLSTQGDVLKVSKIRTPRNLSTKGAKLIQFSPDGRWLGIVKNDNRIVTVRVHLDGSQSSTSYKILPTQLKLDRVNRNTEKHILIGGLGAYDRTVTRMAFSSDSRILAVSDLAGYIDTWLLEGQEDLSQEGEALEAVSAYDDASSASSSDEYESEEEEKKPTVILGQHWIRNPSASLLPNVSAAPVVLSFRPAKDQSSKSNGPIRHVTRNNLHPHSRDLTSGEDRLLVVTATTKVHEFEVLTGRLTEWSRANPTGKFPLEFQNLKDQAMGCLWDVDNEKQRLWLYGSNWLWMFDLSKNFPTEQTDKQLLVNGHAENQKALTNGHGHVQTNGVQEQVSLKRKRGRGTGAGNAVPDSRLNVGMSRKIQMVSVNNNGSNDADENSTVKEMDLDARQAAEDNSDMELDDTEETEAEDDDEVDYGVVEDQEGDEGAADADAADGGRDGDGDDDDDAAATENAVVSAAATAAAGTPSPPWWHTYKYRPIMGVVPLMAAAGMASKADLGIEVALVERPIWESDLPPRYYGGQEWEKPDVW